MFVAFTFIFRFLYEEHDFQDKVFLNELNPRGEISLVNHCHITMKTLDVNGVEEWKPLGSKVDIGKILLAEFRNKLADRRILGNTAELD